MKETKTWWILLSTVWLFRFRSAGSSVNNITERVENFRNYLYLLITRHTRRWRGETAWSAAEHPLTPSHRSFSSNDWCFGVCFSFFGIESAHFAVSLAHRSNRAGSQKIIIWYTMWRKIRIFKLLFIYFTVDSCFKQGVPWQFVPAGGPSWPGAVHLRLSLLWQFLPPTTRLHHFCSCYDIAMPFCSCSDWGRNLIQGKRIGTQSGIIES